MTTSRKARTTAEQILDAFARPFDAEWVRFKPAVVSGNRALALAYLDARAIQDRLDAVVGVAGWQDSYKLLPDGNVVCRLRVKIGGEWITKMDVGGPSEQPDGGDRLKAAFSDSLKRAAVKFGIGRYLYRIPSQWVDYDPQKRQLTRRPQLPAFALPAPGSPPAGPPVDAPAADDDGPAPAHQEAAEPAPSESYQRCELAIKAAVRLGQLDKYQEVYRQRREFSPAQVKALDQLTAARRADIARAAAPATPAAQPA